MDMVFSERFSDSPIVNLVWYARSEQPQSFFSPAVSHWEIVITNQKGKTYLSIVGPQTQLTPAPIEGEATFLGIQFKLGVFMPHYPLTGLVNTGIHLPNANSKSFWLRGATWEFPKLENVEVFVDRLIREDILVFDNIVEKVLQNDPVYLSSRSIQRSFVRATGLSHRKITQIERSHRALRLLQSGLSIRDTVDYAGYADQAHLTRSLKQLVGQTPGQVSHLSQLE